MFFKKKNQIIVQDKLINISQISNEDYICLTDMVKGEEGVDHIKNWMRNRNTVEFLGLWEVMNNEKFKGVEFDTFRKEAGLNNFTLTPKKWVETTNAKGIVSKSGRFSGGTYAHKDIAFEFGSWLSPSFKLYLIFRFNFNWLIIKLAYSFIVSSLPDPILIKYSLVFFKKSDNSSKFLLNIQSSSNITIYS